MKSKISDRKRRTKTIDDSGTISGILKVPTGIEGFDEITGGGLPQGRPALVVGGAGAGKTLFAVEFLIRGALEYNEPGVFIAFEENGEELAQNVASLGFDLKSMEADGRVIVEHVHIERSEIEETGEYDLEGLFIRIGSAIDTIGAKRVVLDTIEALFSGLSNEMILRSELRRLFRWLKDKGVTAVITAEQGNGKFTRHGLEEYVSDAVIFLDHRIENQLSTRRLRVVKYRGTSHGTNEYPFLIGKNGFGVLPITSLGLGHAVSSERVSSGVLRLDAMLGGQGYYRGSTILTSGTAGSGKTSLAAHFASAACKRGEKCLFFAFEESESQILRNMRSIGIDLKPWVKSGLLRFEAVRPAQYGLEIHLAKMHQLIREFEPQVVVIDPITDLMALGSQLEVKAMLVRLIDFLKSRQVTALLSSLTSGGGSMEQSEIGISSLIDTWLLVREVEMNGERARGMYILKSRGMAHSNQVREFLLTDHGVELVDVYLGPNGALMGSARLAQEANLAAEAEVRRQDVERRGIVLERKRKLVKSQIAALQAELAGEEAEFQKVLENTQYSDRRSEQNRAAIAKLRQADD
ncbi:MAG: circadian clock protein KaiC [Chloroflexi bacterium]|nr:circadian clock protein KaiC [Chloroflexota bacterium]